MVKITTIFALFTFLILTLASADQDIPPGPALPPGTSIFAEGTCVDYTGTNPLQPGVNKVSLGPLNPQGHITLEAAQALQQAGFVITVTLFGREQRPMTLAEYQNLLALGAIRPGWPYDHVGADGQPLATYLATFRNGATFNTAILASASASGLNASQITDIMNNDLAGTGLAPVNVWDVITMLQSLGLNPTPGATLLPPGSTPPAPQTPPPDSSMKGSMDYWPTSSSHTQSYPEFTATETKLQSPYTPATIEPNNSLANGVNSLIKAMERSAHSMVTSTE